MLIQFIRELLSEELLRALCWTFIHSLWQGALLAAVGGIIIANTRKAAAHWRYTLLTTLLGLFVGAAALTFVLEWSDATGAAPAFGPVVETTNTTVLPGGQDLPAPTLRTAHPWQVFTAYFDRHAPAVVLIWSLFFFYHFIRLLAGLNYVHRIRYTAVEKPSHEWKERLQQLCHRMGVTQGVQLLQSSVVNVPAVVGFFKPVILVPAGLLTHLPPECVEAVLLHELAHIRRRDFAVNLLQSVVETIFFFNPALMWLSSLVREEREACCDDAVLVATGDRQAYLQALVAFQEAELSPPPYVLALGSRKTHLLNRVRRMLTQENNRLSIMERTILFTGLMAISALAFIPKQEPAVAPATATAALTTGLQPIRTTTPPVRAVAAPQAVQASPARASQAPAPRAVVLDTVPTKKAEASLPAGTYEIRNVTTNVEDQNGRKRAETIAVLKDGRVYRLVQIDNQMTEMSLNGQPIAKEDWNQHLSLWEEIEHRRKVSAERRAQAEQRRIESRKQREADEKVRREERETHRLQAEQKRQEIEHHREQVVAQAAEARAHTEVRASRGARAVHPPTPPAAAVGRGNGREVDLIINELMSRKVITARDPLSFTLTDDELTVNGKKGDDAIRQRLKERLRLDAGDSFQYKREGNSVTTTIVRN